MLELHCRHHPKDTMNAPSAGFASRYSQGCSPSLACFFLAEAEGEARDCAQAGKSVEICAVFDTWLRASLTTYGVEIFVKGVRPVNDTTWVLGE